MRRAKAAFARLLLSIVACLLCYINAPVKEKTKSRSIREVENSSHKHGLVFAAIIDKTVQFSTALEIIGSIHQHRIIGETTSIPLIHIFGRGLEPSMIVRLSLYQRVIYQDLDKCFPCLTITLSDGEMISDGRNWDNEDQVNNMVMNRLLADHENVVLLMAPLQSTDLWQLLLDYGHLHLEKNGSLICRAVRDLECLHAEPKIVNISGRDLGNASVCTALLRADITSWISLYNISKLGVNFRDSIVLGVPTTSRRTHNMSQHPLLTALLPSLHDTCKQNHDQIFVLLLAYDQGDKYFDTQDNKFLDLIYSDKPRNLEVVLIRIPFIGSVSMLWNLLYEIAISQGASYFYQLNDDVKFHSHAWPSAFTKWIDSQRGGGLAGPCDTAFPDCSLLTQNFVGRGHHEIFGFLFPPDLPNWWSDDWLNRVHLHLGKRRCFSNIKISNGNRRDGANPRYQACPYLASHELLVSYYYEKAQL